MDKLSYVVTKYKKSVVALFVLLSILCALLIPFVPINYNMMSYLPEDTSSTRALSVLEDDFTTGVPNLRALATVDSIPEALELKSQIAQIPGVDEVLWLDDATDIHVPTHEIPADMTARYISKDQVLFDVVVHEGYESEAVKALYDVVGESGALSGQAVNMASARNMAGGEVANAFLILVPLIIVVLILSTRSWLEPLLFMVTIGVSVVLNMGTNIFIGNVSYIAYTIAPILQLAVSLDYAIFLLHAFHRESASLRLASHAQGGFDEAMRSAMRASFSAIAASAATTAFGFAVLSLMQFKIGADLGITLVKGIVLSFVCVVVFLPALALLVRRWVDACEHRAFLPSFEGVGARLLRVRTLVFVLVVVIIVPCVLAQSHIDFTYGMGSVDDATSRVNADEQRIDDTFGRQNALVVLIPQGDGFDAGRSAEITRMLEEIPLVRSVISYESAVGSEVPTWVAGPQVREQFFGNGFERIIVNADIPTEGKSAFETVERVHDVVQPYFSAPVYVGGAAASLYDMSQVVARDNVVTNIAAVVAILLILCITFRGVLVPLLIVVTIESAIMINLAVPYFVGDSLNYLGFLVINTVQLGATVDYAILLSDTYRQMRTEFEAREALTRALSQSFKSMLTSALILTCAGLVLWGTSSNSIVSLLGMLLARGCVLSFVLVNTLLPAWFGIAEALEQRFGIQLFRARSVR